MYAISLLLVKHLYAQHALYLQMCSHKFPCSKSHLNRKQSVGSGFIYIVQPSLLHCLSVVRCIQTDEYLIGVFFGVLETLPFTTKKYALYGNQSVWQNWNCSVQAVCRQSVWFPQVHITFITLLPSHYKMCLLK